MDNAYLFFVCLKNVKHAALQAFSMLLPLRLNHRPMFCVRSKLGY